LRPGEKLYEELLIGENVMPTQHELIMSADEDYLSWSQIEDYVEKFGKAIGRNDVETSRSLMMEAVKGFIPQCEIADLVYDRSDGAKNNNQESNILKYKQ